MKKETRNMGIGIAGLMTLLSGCQTLDRKPEYKFGECQMSRGAYRYLVGEVGADAMSDYEENERFCEQFSEIGKYGKYLTKRKAKEGMQALAGGSPHQ